jgi:putative salt-induced outer membrane protein
MLRRVLLSVAPALIALTAAEPVRAELAAPVRALIEAAIETGNADKVSTIVELARQTNPDDVEEIDALHQGFLAERRQRAAAEAQQRELAIRNAGLFDSWSGRGEVGAFQSTGNSENVGVTVGVSLQRTGIDWQHRLRSTVDYQRSNGRTSREQYLFAYEPRYTVNGDLFVYALAQYEKDRFQGFSSRISTSGGLGYQVLDGESLDLSLKAGPAWRRTDLISGETQDSLGALAGLDFNWRILPQLTLTQDTDLVAESGGRATAIITSAATSVLLATGLEAKISDGLTTRVSYTVDYNSNPPPGAVSTDTLTRFTLVYGF